MANTKCKPLPKFLAVHIRRFWKFVDKRGPDECWPWKGAKTPHGYGVMRVLARNVYATRMMFKISTGNDPYPLDLMHKCDYPPCCNPDHLKRGTHAENMYDAFMKGRNPRDERHGCCKYSDEKVRKVKLMLSQVGIFTRSTCREIATVVGVPTGLVREVRRNVRRKHVS